MASRVPLRRHVPLSRAGQRKLEERTLNDLCRDLVFLRDGYKCVKCGKPCREIVVKKDGSLSYPGFQWGHIHSRTKKSMQWTPENSACFCAACHLWWHHHPTLAVEWFRERYPERMNRLDLQARTPGRIDRGASRLYLQSELRRLKAERRTERCPNSE